MRHMSITRKLILGGLLIVLMPVLCIGTISVLKFSTELESRGRSEVALTAKNLSQMIELTLAQELNMVKEISANETLVEAADYIAQKGVDSSKIRVEMAGHLFGKIKNHIGQNYEAILLVDPNGTVYADSEEGAYKGLTASDRDYFKAAKAGKSTVGTVARSKKTDQPVAFLAAPMINEKKQFIGTVVIILKLEYLVDKVTGTRLGSTGYVYMTDESGMTIAHPDKENILKMDIKTNRGMEDIARAITAGQSGVQYFNFSGEETVGGYAPVELARWSVVATESLKELKAPIRAMQMQILLISGAFLGAILILVIYFGRRLSRPIEYAAAGLSDVSDLVASASSQVSTASQQLAEGASEQAAAIEETSSSLEEMASMTRQNAENASNANGLMRQTTDIVSLVGQSMEHLTSSMTEISNASEETQKIVKTIDEIAFQTNLLALNAAVEAARAGDAGAGFAVVADEVRNLALRAAEAARNTANLIEGTVRKINDGSTLVEQTAERFSMASTNVSKMGDLVGEIAAASHEQAEGIQQVNRAVAEMDKIVQRNSATAEESASASEEMNAQAERMKDFVTDLVMLVGGNSSKHVKYSDDKTICIGPPVNTAAIPVKLPKL
jgi:methyl-accepting chemotaxis protein